MSDAVPAKALLARLPAEWPVDPRQVLHEARALDRTVVVVDDDPTGTQTVHNVPVLTDWTEATLRAELAQSPPCLYLLTNSRSMPVSQARDINYTIGQTLRSAVASTHRRICLVSRSDSTLRGHFPDEVDALVTGYGFAPDAWVLVPAFVEGGRVTIDDVHYLTDGDSLVPVASTPFAKDEAFGYQNSDLVKWTIERGQGRFDATHVTSLGLGEVRRDGPDAVSRRLASLEGGRVCVVNAASRGDLEVVALGLLRAEQAGKTFVYRSAASIVPLLAGIAPRVALSAPEVRGDAVGPGLVVVGSHVPLTTAQTEVLLASGRVTGIELSVNASLDPMASEGEAVRVSTAVEQTLAAGRDAMVFTSREVLTGSSREASLEIGRVVSAALVAVVRRLRTRPGYLIAKGGITSSDLATQALRMRRCVVEGQVLPGVPVWRCGPESRYPGLPYVVFPGNVGGPEALLWLVDALRTQPPPEGAPCPRR